jgi:Soluble lytic murein transglycosylase and related regulatory proteins (some contain LysM/invasin domains)
MRASPGLIAILSMLHASVALADLWAYVDEQGHSHVANRQVDSRYRLFFKGATTLDAPTGAAEARARAIDALAGTRLYARATDPAVAQRYARLIETNARANGLDPALVKAVVAVESQFDARAVSERGAVGLMQVMPATGERYGVTPDARRSVADKLLDPALNVRIGTRYLKNLLERFESDLSLTLAAYNAGEGAVETHHNTVPPFAETRDYVRLVQQLYAIYAPQQEPPPARVRIVRTPPQRDAAVESAVRP